MKHESQHYSKIIKIITTGAPFARLQDENLQDIERLPLSGLSMKEIMDLLEARGVVRDQGPYAPTRTVSSTDAIPPKAASPVSGEVASIKQDL